jgi:hypothetical protein
LQPDLGTISYLSKVTKKREKGLSFEIDELTNSIKNVVSGDSFATDITLAGFTDVKLANKKKGWEFDWELEFKEPTKDVYKLSIVNNQAIVQRLISPEVMADHVYMHLIESAPFNRGKKKMYAGVPGNLVAFACKLSFQRGHEGNLSFLSKTKLVQHVGGRVMIINTNAALRLINKYFDNEK